MMRVWLVPATAALAVVWGAALVAQHGEPAAGKPPAVEAKTPHAAAEPAKTAGTKPGAEPAPPESQAGRISIAPQLGKVAPTLGSSAPSATKMPESGEKKPPPATKTLELVVEKKPTPVSSPNAADQLRLRAAVGRIEQRLADVADLHEVSSAGRPVAPRTARIVLTWRTSLTWPAEILAPGTAAPAPGPGRVTLVWP